ncbi:MAG TPA: cobalamin-binding protein [Roseiflexaceae bacterium]|nr:cobalamin-binding protein [Roseiflexaceae bacterium]
MRIISLLPSATEIVYALGLGDSLVGVTHECDYPADAKTRPVVTRSVLDHSDATSAEIDHAVSNQLANGLSIYELDTALLAALQPDLILTQALCDVCAVSYDAVQHAVHDVTAQMGGIAPRVLSLEPSSLHDIFQTIEIVGDLTGTTGRAAEVLADLQRRVEHVRAHAVSVRRRPRVACLEWVDPLYGPGHWMPELVQIAGGTPGLGQARKESRQIAWSDIIAFAPEIMLIAPCGFGLERAVEETMQALPHRAGWDALPAVRAGRVYVADGNAYFSRPGPRIVESLEMLAAFIHPETCAGWGPREAWTTLASTPAQNIHAE